MEIENIFCNFIARDYLSIDNNIIEKFCRNRIEHNPRTYSPQPNHTNPKPVNQTRFSEEDLQEEPLSELFVIIHKKINELHTRLGYIKTHYQGVTDSWATINDGIYTSVAHQHPGSFFSGIYYVKGQVGQSPLKFMTPNVTQEYTTIKMIENYNNFTSTSYTEHAETGKLIIFPSWLFHYVETSLNSEDRISLAFNTSVFKNGDQILYGR